MKVVSSFLFALFEGGGNVPLLIPVVRAVAERGHDVTVVAGPGIRRPNAPPDQTTRPSGNDATELPMK